MTNNKFQSQIRLNKLKTELDEYTVIIQKYNKEFKADGNVDKEEQAFLDKLSLTLSKLSSRVMRLQLKLKDTSYTDAQLQPEKNDITPVNQLDYVSADDTPVAAASSLSGSVGKGGTNAHADVLLVQEWLNKQGNKLVADGLYGKNTFKALSKYQKQLWKEKSAMLAGLKPYQQNDPAFKITQGIIEVGDLTYLSLSGATPKVVEPAAEIPAAVDKIPAAADDTPVAAASSLSGSVGKGGTNAKADVLLVQEWLNKQGNKLVVDGLYGKNTFKALSKYQKQLWKEKSAMLASLKPYQQNDPAFKITQGIIEVGDLTYLSLSGATSTVIGDASITASTTLRSSVGRSGDNNPADVMLIQELLNDHGYNVAINGDFNSETLLALRDFQQTLTRQYSASPEQLGMSMTNVNVGDFTLNALTQKNIPADMDNASVSVIGDASITASTTLRSSVGRSGDNNPADVMLIQELLNDHGYNVAINGDFNSETLLALRDFQQTLTRQYSASPEQLGMSMTNVNVGDFTLNALTQKNIPADMDNVSVSTVDDTPVKAAKKLAGTVGRSGTNDPADVMLIQKLLNKHGKKLTVNGKFDSETLNALHSFQKSLARRYSQSPKQLGMSIANVRAGDFTWKALSK